jgi:hypothetical protein
MENKEKSIGYIVLTILELFLVFCYILTVQFGWNQILTTIVPVNTLSLVQTFGLALVTELLFKGIRKRINQKKEQIAQKKKTDTEAIENIIKEKSNKTITDEY